MMIPQLKWKYLENFALISAHEVVAQSGTYTVSTFAPSITLGKGGQKGFSSWIPSSPVSASKVFMKLSGAIFALNFIRLCGLEMFLPYLHWDSLFFKPQPILTPLTNPQIAECHCWQTLIAFQLKLAGILGCKFVIGTFSLAKCS